jgi:hypothetical protein
MKRNCIPLFLMTAVLLATSPVWAVNKCTGAGGKVTYQDAPCTTDKSEAVHIFKSDPQPPAVRQKALALCEEGIRAAGMWKDPDSLKISDVVRIGFTTITLHDARTMVVQYGASVNGKNSYGAYVGSKPAICYFDQTETRLLSVRTF